MVKLKAEEDNAVLDQPEEMESVDSADTVDPADRVEDETAATAGTEDEGDAADRHHEERIAEASKAVAEAAVYLSRAQSAAKVAKKFFDESVQELKGIIDGGPERLPLFDAANGQSVKSPGEKPSYDPPLEEGQCRVRIIQIDPEINQEDVPKAFVPGAVIVMQSGRVAKLDGPETEAHDFSLDSDTDDYEVIEYWPDGDGGPTVVDPPLVFGPNKPEQEEQRPDPEAWRQESVGKLNIPKGTINKLRDAGLVKVGQLSDRMVGVQWYRGISGIGESAAEKIAEAFEAFWQQHPEAVD